MCGKGVVNKQKKNITLSESEVISLKYVEWFEQPEETDAKDILFYATSTTKR